MIERIINYCKQPIYNVEKEKISLKIFLKLYLIYILTAIFISLPIGLLAKLFDITNNFKNYSWQFLVYGFTIAPILEEILFRLLLRPSKKKFYIFLGTNILWIIVLIILHKYFAVIIISGIFSLALFLIFFKIRNKINLISKFRFLFYLSVGIFGFIHISNFEGITFLNFFIAPILVFPQLIMGFLNAYIRMIYGFRHAVFFHIFVNMTVIVPYLLIMLVN
jgi:hypothetical protein